MIVPYYLIAGAKAPVRSSDQAAGYDLFYHGDKVIELGVLSRAMVPTGIHMALPVGYFARLEARSGLAIKHGLTLLCGVVDSDYRGPLNIVMINLGERKYYINPGEKIAQMVIHNHETAEFGPRVYNHEDLPATIRGTGGFGSTGNS